MSDADLIERFTGVGAELAAGGTDFAAQWKVLATHGLFRTDDGTDSFGGAVRRRVAAVEGLGAGGLDAGLCYAAASQMFGMQLPLRPILTTEQREMLAGVDDGSVLLCHASTEEGGGSDPLSCTTVAEPADGGYRLRGRKAFVTAAPIAGRAIVFARTAAGRSAFALTAFLVDLTAPGVTATEPLAKTVLTGVPMGKIDFADVWVPAAAVLGGEGAGLAVLNATTTWERALLQAFALGAARRLIDRTVGWSAERTHFGRAMAASHLVAARVADMTIRLRRSRTLIYDAADRLDAGVDSTELAALAAVVKVSVTEDLIRLTENAAALSGVRAFIADSGYAVDLASPFAGLVYAGGNDLLRLFIARDAGLPVGN